MPTQKSTESTIGLLNESTIVPVSRRKFLGYVGASTALLATAAMASCHKDDNNSSSTGVNLGGNDTGVLNYAYALEQLEAAFYTQVVANAAFSTNFSVIEQGYFADIRDHEIAHREFFKAALGSNAIPGLEVDFSTINFADRNSVLGTAKAFEDLGVTAYNGAGKLITNKDYLTLAGKIVSVEARHAALIRDIISAGSFADNTAVNAMGLDGARTPSEVLAIAGTYIKTKINASNLPTS